MNSNGPKLTTGFFTIFFEGLGGGVSVQPQRPYGWLRMRSRSRAGWAGFIVQVAVQGLVMESQMMMIGFVGCPNGHGE
jgi:hypothetical protein